jgi:hypothetical protein
MQTVLLRNNNKKGNPPPKDKGMPRGLVHISKRVTQDNMTV